MMKKAAFLLVSLLLSQGTVVAFVTPHGRQRTELNRLPTVDNSGVRCRTSPLNELLKTCPGLTKTHLLATSSDDKEEKKSGPFVNLGLVRQTVLNQVLIGSTIWTGGYGSQVLARDAQFVTSALLLGIVGVLPLIFFSRSIETSEAPSVADLNLSTNMLVLRLFGDKPQPFTAFLVSALVAGLTGLVEETTFRGEVLPQLAQRFDSVPVGFALSTLLFAVLHLNIIGLLRGGGDSVKDAAVLVGYQIVTGSVFGALFLLTDNLAVPIIAHALFDFYVFFWTHLTVTTQMDYARSEALMPVAPRGVEAKWQRERSDKFLVVARETFYLADSNRDGVLSREELRIALYSYGIRLTTEESVAVTQAADKDQSGTIDFAEFLEFVGPTGSPGKAIKNSLLGVN